jgi:hypothetical protein
MNLPPQKYFRLRASTQPSPGAEGMLRPLHVHLKAERWYSLEEVLESVSPSLLGVLVEIGSSP